jgi:hypothetical protein
MKALNEIKFLKNNFSNKFLEKLSLKMEEHVFGSDELIQKANTLEEPTIHFIAKGEVDLFIEIGSHDDTNII